MHWGLFLIIFTPNIGTIRNKYVNNPGVTTLSSFLGMKSSLQQDLYNDTYFSAICTLSYVTSSIVVRILEIYKQTSLRPHQNLIEILITTFCCCNENKRPLVFVLFSVTCSIVQQYF